MAHQPFTASTVLSDQKEPFIRNSTRWEYFSRYLPYWFAQRRNRSYGVVAGGIGVLLLVRNLLPLAVIAFAAGAYFYTTADLQTFILQSRRRLIMAD